jgi:hypothetical protein
LGTEAAPLTVTARLSWSAPLDTPEAKVFTAEIRDPGLDPEADPVAVITGPAWPLPVGFAAPLSGQDRSTAETFAIRARIQDGYAILLATDGDYPLAPALTPEGLTLELFDPEDLARGNPRVMITPAGSRYTCNGEPLTIAVEAGAAYVTFGDGTSVKLPKTDSAVDGVNQFSTGRFLVQQFMDPSGSYTLHFARGRAAALPCEPAE